MPSLGRRLCSSARASWKKICWVLGISGGFDWWRDYGRAKLMDSIYIHLGSIGQWLLNYKWGVVTTAVTVVIGFLVISAILDSKKIRQSLIVDPFGSPYEYRNISPKSLFLIIIAGLCACVLLAFGAYSYYRTNSATLLRRYPLGYVLFDLSKKEEVFPYSKSGDFSDFVLDWSVVNWHEESNGIIIVRMPDVYDRNGDLLIGNIGAGGSAKVGRFPQGAKHLAILGNTVIDGEILSIHENGIVFVLGMKNAPKPHAGL